MKLTIQKIAFVCKCCDFCPCFHCASLTQRNSLMMCHKGCVVCLTLTICGLDFDGFCLSCPVIECYGADPLWLTPPSGKRFRWYLKRADSNTASNSSLKLMLLFCKYPKRCRYRLNCDMPVILVPLPALLRLWMLRFVMAILVADCVSVWASVGVVEAMCEGDKRRRMKKSVKEYLTERNMVVA